MAEDHVVNNQNSEPEQPHASPQSEPEAKLAEAEKKRDEYLAGWQRAKADFLNYKKDEMRRFEDLARYANEGLLQEFITTLDNFDLAIASLEKAGPLEKGVYLIRTQIEDILRKRGVERIAVGPGDPFDPAFMEAIAETAGKGPPGSVADEIEAGYRLHEKVIRPARVRIIKEKSQH